MSKWHRAKRRQRRSRRPLCHLTPRFSTSMSLSSSHPSTHPSIHPPLMTCPLSSKPLPCPARQALLKAKTRGKTKRRRPSAKPARGVMLDAPYTLSSAKTVRSVRRHCQARRAGWVTPACLSAYLLICLLGITVSAAAHGKASYGTGHVYPSIHPATYPRSLHSGLPYNTPAKIGRCKSERR
ncbi:hypothetical protein IWX46DRAFT_381782 [Phyllosticta citricarpa]|uniref:Uncharacterized protein n=1 Tax=Phyllosticta citricarpa TaxID=55181 RepID=A0ABR1MJR1_9PEZI